MIPGLLAAAAIFLAAPAAETASGSRTSGDINVVGNSYTVPAGETRDGSVTVSGGTLRIEGTVTGDATVVGGSMVVDGTVDGSVSMVGGAVHLGPHSSVGHDVTVFGGSVTREEGAQVGGDVSTMAGRGVGRGPGHFPFPDALWNWFGFVFGLLTAAGLVLIGLVVNLFFPNQVATTGAAVVDRPLASLGFGCLTAVAGVLLAVLLGVTIVLGIVSLAIAVVMTAGWILGWTAIILLVGQRLMGALNWPGGPVPALLLGGLLAALVVNVPVLGGLIALLGGALALGAAVLTRFGTRPPGAAVPVASGPPTGPGWSPPRQGGRVSG